MKQCAYAGEGAREHSLQQAGLSVSAVKVSILLFGAVEQAGLSVSAVKVSMLLFGAVEAAVTGTVCQP